MKKQEILDLLGIEELPEAGQPGKNKCAALVQRTTGQYDYVITKGGGVITDIGYKAAIVKIVEFYPVQKKAPTHIPEQPQPEKEKPTLVQEPVSTGDNFTRLKMISFLKKQNFSEEKLSKKTDKQLKELMDGFKK